MNGFFRALAAIWILAAPAAAQYFLPALYRVVGVAAGDVLNVRLGPGPEFEIVATLAPDATGIEVAAINPGNGWLLVNVDDLAGYASPRFLQRLPGAEMREFPLPLYCGGTEPFWGLGIQQDGTARYYDPIEPERSFSLDWSGPASSRLGDEFGMVLSGAGEGIQAVIQRNYCTDGMSEYAFGLKIDAIVRSGNETMLMTGCCALSR